MRRTKLTAHCLISAAQRKEMNRLVEVAKKDSFSTAVNKATNRKEVNNRSCRKKSITISRNRSWQCKHFRCIH